MFCPRCGRPVSDTANFCGGCGMPKTEIERMLQVAPVTEPAPVEIDIADIDSTISQLEGDLTGINPVENYTTETTVNTNKVEDEFSNSDVFAELKPENSVYNQVSSPKTDYSIQSEYSANAPKYPVYTQPAPQPVPQPEVKVEKDQSVTTVDFIWMMLISGLPVIGLVYLLYTAFVQDNMTKRSWAKATLIIYAFAAVMAMVFTMGIMMTSFMFW